MMQQGPGFNSRLLVRVRVPEVDVVVVTSRRGDEILLRVPGGGVDPVVVLFEFDETRVRRQIIDRRDPARARGRAHQRALSVRRKDDRVDRFAEVRVRRLHEFACLAIPEIEGLVESAREEQRAPRRKRHRRDIVGVFRARREDFKAVFRCLALPEDEVVVVSSGGETQSIRSEVERVDRLFVAFENFGLRKLERGLRVGETREVPHEDLRVDAARGEPEPIVAEIEAKDRVFMTAEHRHDLVRFQINDAYGLFRVDPAHREIAFVCREGRRMELALVAFSDLAPHRADQLAR